MRSLLLIIASFVLLFTASPANGQVASSLSPEAYREHKTVIETLLETVVGLVRDAALETSTASTSDRLSELTRRLSMIPNGAPLRAASVQRSSGDGDSEDLEALRRLLLDIRAELVAVQSLLDAEGEMEAASKRIRRARNSVNDALAEVQRETERRKPDEDWLTPGRYDGDEHGAISRHDVHDDDWPTSKNRVSSDDGSDWDEDDSTPRDWRKWRRGPFRSSSDVGTFVGDFTYGWPYRETGIYRPLPSIRYNRVEGFVLGIRKQPLSWDSVRRATVYGQGAYAFGSERWQYEAGGEVRAGKRYGGDYADLKVGASYRRLTTTNDLWKSSWFENTVASFFFNYDFFDYYEVEGWTAYAAARVSPFLQLTAGYREEKHRSLMQEVTWSLFGGKHFRFNPAAATGDMNLVVLALEGGAVDDLGELPSGAAFRIEAEFGDGLGGDFSFNRYVGDGRLYIPLSYRSSLGLRVRGGIADGTVPYQKTFTLGGLGSMRGYPQNALVGNRMLVGNAEYALLEDILVDDVLLLGFFDAGWVNSRASDKFDFNDLVTSAGVGFGFGDRTFRLELAFPLRNVDGDRDPELWVRVAPSF